MYKHLTAKENKLNFKTSTFGKLALATFFTFIISTPDLSFAAPKKAPVKKTSLFGSFSSKKATKSVAKAKVTRRSRSVPPGTLFTMYRHETAAGGLCIPVTKEDPKNILKRNGIKTIGKPTASEVKALAKGIGQVERLLGDPLPKTWRQDYQYHTASGKWNQGAHTINVRRPVGSPKGSNVGRLIHELGHKVGNAGVYSQYASYTRNVDCNITGYATTKDNEEFAEVFSAYVTYPDLLAQKCPKAYEFFSKKLFPNSQTKVASCKNFKPNFDQDEDDTEESTTAIANKVYNVIPAPRPDIKESKEEAVVVEAELNAENKVENTVASDNSDPILPTEPDKIPVPKAAPERVASQGVR